MMSEGSARGSTGSSISGPMSSFRNWQGFEACDKSERERTYPDEPEGTHDGKHTKKVKIGFGCNVDVKV